MAEGSNLLREIQHQGQRDGNFANNRRTGQGNAKSRFTYPDEKMSTMQVDNWIKTGGQSAQNAANGANRENMANQPPWHLIFCRRVMELNAMLSKHDKQSLGGLIFSEMVLANSVLKPGTTISGGNGFVLTPNVLQAGISGVDEIREKTQAIVHDAFSHSRRNGHVISIFDESEEDLDIDGFVDLHDRGLCHGLFKDGFTHLNTMQRVNGSRFQSIRNQLIKLCSPSCHNSPDYLIWGCQVMRFSFFCTSLPFALLTFLSKEKLLYLGVQIPMVVMSLPYNVDYDDSICDLPEKYTCSMFFNSWYLTLLEDVLKGGPYQFALDNEGKAAALAYYHQITGSLAKKLDMEMIGHLKHYGVTDDFLESTLSEVELTELGMSLQHVLQKAVELYIIDKTLDFVLEKKSIRQHKMPHVVIPARYFYGGLAVMFVLCRHLWVLKRPLICKQFSGGFNMSCISGKSDQRRSAGEMMNKVLHTCLNMPGCICPIESLRQQLKNDGYHKLDIQTILFYCQKKCSEPGFLGSVNKAEKPEDVEAFYKGDRIVIDQAELEKYDITMSRYCSLFYSPMNKRPKWYRSEFHVPWEVFYGKLAASFPDFGLNENRNWMDIVKRIRDNFGFGLESWPEARVHFDMNNNNIYVVSSDDKIALKTLKDIKQCRVPPHSNEQKLICYRDQLRILETLCGDLPEYAALLKKQTTKAVRSVMGKSRRGEHAEERRKRMSVVENDFKGIHKSFVSLYRNLLTKIEIQKELIRREKRRSFELRMDENELSTDQSEFRYDFGERQLLDNPSCSNDFYRPSNDDDCFGDTPNLPSIFTNNPFVGFPVSENSNTETSVDDVFKENELSSDFSLKDSLSCSSPSNKSDPKFKDFHGASNEEIREHVRKCYGDMEPDCLEENWRRSRKRKLFKSNATHVQTDRESSWRQNRTFSMSKDSAD